jgi:hypothetical protein
VQYAQQVVPDGMGGGIIGWTDERGGTHVYVQRVTALGDVSAGWPADGIALTTGSYSQQLFGAVPDGTAPGSGEPGAILVWTDSRYADIYAQRVLGSGAIAPGWPAKGLAVCALYSLQYNPAVVPDGAGGALVAWQDWRDFVQPDLYIQRVAGAGVPAWTANGVPVCSETHYQYPGVIATDGAGGAYVAWVDLRNGSGDIYAQHITAAGQVAPGWDANGNPVCVAAGEQGNVAIVADGAGGAIVAWNGGPASVSALRIGSNGAASAGWSANGNPVREGVRDPVAPLLSPDGLGGAFVVWSELRSGVPGESDLFAQHMTAAGARAWPLEGVTLCAAPYAQNATGVCPDASGGFYVAWGDYRSGASEDVYALRVTASGARAPGWFPDGTPISAAAFAQTVPVVVADGLGGALLCWQDDRGASRDLYAMRAVGDGPVPVELALVSAETAPGLARLTWYASGTPFPEAVAYRRAEPGDWSRLAVLLPDGSGRLVLEDRDVLPGHRYGYRLGVRDGAVERFVGETSVEIPAALGFALESPRPNPTTGRALQVAFVLPDDARATLALFDVSGRLLESREVGALGAGRHLVTLGAAQPLEPGLHFVRLERHGQVRIAKALVVR